MLCLGFWLGQTSVEAVDTLASIMRNKKAPAAARAMASNSILDRGYGKPPQMLSATVTARRQVRDMSDAEIAVSRLVGGNSAGNFSGPECPGPNPGPGARSQPQGEGGPQGRAKGPGRGPRADCTGARPAARTQRPGAIDHRLTTAAA